MPIHLVEINIKEISPYKREQCFYKVANSYKIVKISLGVSIK